MRQNAVGSLSRTQLAANYSIHVIALFFFLSIAVCRFAHALQPTAVPCGLTPAEAAGLNGDAGTDADARSTYKKTISGLLRRRKFVQLDCLADSARSHKETFPGGMWKLRTIYSALEKPPLHATQQDWILHMSLVKEWTAARPRSITARVALAESYVSYGWDARGDGESETVSSSGWRLFKERAAQARLVLKQASTLSVKCPEWYVAMQYVALAQDWEPNARQALFEQAVAFAPDYYYYYRLYANSILPKWGGETGQAEAFVQNSADRVGGEAGDILYFQIASTLLCYCGGDQTLKLSWPRIQRGFAAIEKHNGTSLENWNLLARMAASFNDPVAANKMLARIGDQWSEEVWQTSAYFESIKAWASQVAHAMHAKTPEEQSAEDDARTPEGQRYNVAVNEKFAALIPACTQESGGYLNGEFEILLKIGKDGTPQTVITVGLNPVGSCILGKMNFPRPSDQSKFPPPPKPDYWFRFGLNLEDSPSAALK
jgi:hypothetical protein